MYAITQNLAVFGGLIVGILIGSWMFILFSWGFAILLSVARKANSAVVQVAPGRIRMARRKFAFVFISFVALVVILTVLYG
jgi:hypothetical protein